ncbi:MAG: pilus assembly protein PilM [Beggiatoa sp. IS2]|nr:MAG: pilus assembly protein PilM [Beggiatoa sp. IS2]
MGIFRLKPDPLVGIDISSTAVKLLELSRTGKGYRVESYGMEPLPEKAVEDKNIVEIEVVGNAVQRVGTRSKPRTRYATVAVAGPAVMTKVITLQGGMSDADMKAAIELDAEQYIPYPINEVHLDFEVIGKNDKEEDRIDVLLVASRSENVETRVAALELGGFKVKVVDVEKFALENAFVLIAQNDPEIKEDEIVALVEVGATTTTLNVLSSQKIVYTKEEIFGGKRLTEDIQRRFGLSYEEANLAKRDGSLPDEYESEVLEPFKADMAQQISRMVQFYYGAGGGGTAPGKLSHVLIAGGCASIPGIVEEVSNKVGGHVSIVNPFAAMSVASRVGKKALMNDAPALMIACGLALRSFDQQH